MVFCVTFKDLYPNSYFNGFVPSRRWWNVESIGRLVIDAPHDSFILGYRLPLEDRVVHQSKRSLPKSHRTSTPARWDVCPQQLFFIVDFISSGSRHSKTRHKRNSIITRVGKYFLQKRFSTSRSSLLPGCLMAYSSDPIYVMMNFQAF